MASWLGSAAAAGVQPLVAFDHDRGDRCPSAPCALPSVGAYEAAVRAFLAAYPQVRLITPWNEANHAAEPTAGRPDRAAAYYNAARRACPACTLVAADVIDGPGMLSWLAEYRRGLDETPQVWGLHDYYDTTYFTTSGLRDYLGAVPGQVWLTETGGIVELRTRDGRVSLPPRRAARARLGELRVRGGARLREPRRAHVPVSVAGRLRGPLRRWPDPPRRQLAAGARGRPHAARGRGRPRPHARRDGVGAWCTGRAPCGPRAGDGPRLGSRRRPPAVSDGA